MPRFTWNVGTALLSTRRLHVERLCPAPGEENTTFDARAVRSKTSGKRHIAGASTPRARTAPRHRNCDSVDSDEINLRGMALARSGRWRDGKSGLGALRGRRSAETPFAEHVEGTYEAVNVLLHVKCHEA